MKPIITRRKRVVGLTEYRPERGYVGRFPTYFNLLREETRVFGVLVRAKELDREEVSIHDKIEVGLLGSTRFVSKFAPLGSDGYLLDA